MTKYFTTPILLLWACFLVLAFLLPIAHYADAAEEDCPTHRYCFAQVETR